MSRQKVKELTERIEKIDSAVPVKLQASVKRAVPRPRSKWIREVIIKELEREAEETS